MRKSTCHRTKVRCALSSFDTVPETVRENGRDSGSRLPLLKRIAGHRYTGRQLLAADVAAVAAVFVFVAVTGPHKLPRISGNGWHAVNRIADVVAALVVLGRRRFPLATLAVLLAVTLPILGLRGDGPAVFYLVFALYSVVVVSSPRAGRWVTAAVLVTSLLSVCFGGGDLEGSSVTGVAAVILLGWLAGEYARSSRQYAQYQRDLEAERAAEAESLRADEIRQAIEGERVKIARELHDVVAHAMSVIAVRSGVARMVIDSQPEQAREALSIIETTTRRTLHEMRLLVGMLRDADEEGAELGPAPGVDDLGRLVEEIESAGVMVELTVVGARRPLSPAVDLSVYRIIQEALTNVVRHAGPTTAQVCITYRPDIIEIAVRDDGAAPGGAPGRTLTRHGAGHGIIGMRERTVLFGGGLRVGPGDGGYSVEASLRTDG
jgi:signal transduction histidine kinase